MKHDLKDPVHCAKCHPKTERHKARCKQCAPKPMIVEARVTCFACPTQWEGTLDDGRAFYFRERHNRARLDIPYGTTVAVRDHLRDDELPVGLAEFVAMFPEVGIAPDAKIGTFDDYIESIEA